MDVININNVYKKFRVYHDKGSTLKEKILFKHRNKFEDRWVLNGINLTIKKGQTIGLIGENGSGKSTLLKMLTKIIYPNEGHIDILGKVSSLLELGAGFHPDMTGRENIYTNASIFGLNKSEIEKKLDKIITFSELNDYIDNPVRTYSSGMYMRLAFSVAINVDAEILLIDEILAVGDDSFQKKCFEKIEQMKREGITIVIVSHDLGSIERICDRVIWIKDGIIHLEGCAKKTIDKYLQYMNNRYIEIIEKEHENHMTDDKQEEKHISHITDDLTSIIEERWGGKEVEIVKVGIIDSDRQIKYAIITGDEISIEIQYKKNINMTNYVFGIGIFNQDRLQVYGTNTHIDSISINNLKEIGTVTFRIRNMKLLAGKYLLDVAVHDKNGRAYDYQTNICSFEVVNNLTDIGLVRLDHEWSIM